MSTVVKFMCAGDAEGPVLDHWRRQLPDDAPTWGDCSFTFDPNCREYDWLVVYDCLPRTGSKMNGWEERLACPPENTLLVTVEPSSIKVYDRAFLSQFGHVLTGHEPWSIDLPGVIRSQPGLRWFYGAGGAVTKTWTAMAAEERPEKAGIIGTVCSAKQQKHTMHHQRYLFTNRLKQDFPELEIFGLGVRPIDDKAEAVDPFRLHLAIENHRCDHWWTEKVADAFLGWSLPIYCGCTNLGEYFPADSFVEIDIEDYEGAKQLLRQAIDEGEYEKRLPAIAEARRRILHDYNLFAVVAKLAAGEGRPPPNPNCSAVLHSRHQLRYRNPVNLASYLWQSTKRYWRGYTAGK